MLMRLLHKISSMTPVAEKQGTKNKQTNKNICSVCFPPVISCQPNLERELCVGFGLGLGILLGLRNGLFFFTWDQEASRARTSLWLDCVHALICACF